MLQFLLFSMIALAKTSAVSCDCPIVACPVCTHSDGLSFVSEHCGESGLGIRSCSRPKCLPDNTPDCLPTAEKSNSENRGLASVAPSGAQENVIGKVQVLKGEAQLISPDGSSNSLSVGDIVHEHDAIVTQSGGAAMVEFADGNRLHIQPETNLKIQRYDMDQAHNVLLELVKGKIRNQVKQKYDGKTSKYQVVTPGVVAGVRGTDFVIDNDLSKGEITHVETFHGTVEVKERIGLDSAMVGKGQAVSFVMPDIQLPTDGPQKGAFNPVRKLTDTDLIALNQATELAPDGYFDSQIPAPKQADPFICAQPNARLNQCLWRCQGNPKGSKSCRTDLPRVSCVRMRCNANGEWSEETRLPASAGPDCSATGAFVDDCDY